MVTLTAEELEWLLEGFDIFRQPHKMPAALGKNDPGLLGKMSPPA